MKNKLAAFVINGQPIPGSFWGKLLKYCNGDKEQAARILYRARSAKALSVIKWIEAGLRPTTDKSLPWALRACADEVDHPDRVRQWIDSEIYKIVPAKVSDCIQEAAMAMLEGLK